MPKFECAAILFDMDGVLVDSTPAVARAWNRWALANGLDPKPVIDGAHGRRTVETIRAFAPHIDAEKEARRIESVEAMDLEGVTVIPGAAQLLRSLPEGKWGVVTSATRPMATSRLRDTGLVVPRVLVSADDVVNGKPHPEPYLKGAAGLGIAPELCLVFEDSPAGIRAANDAGMRVIALRTTYPPGELQEAKERIGNFTEIRVERNQSGNLEITFVE
jgi:sugar-phosphatase